MLKILEVVLRREKLFEQGEFYCSGILIHQILLHQIVEIRQGTRYRPLPPRYRQKNLTPSAYNSILKGTREARQHHLKAIISLKL